MDEEVRFSLRVPEELLKRVRRVAAQQERSVNYVMVRALRDYVEEEDKRR